jgi:hypothetical protein
MTKQFIFLKINLQLFAEGAGGGEGGTGSEGATGVTATNAVSQTKKGVKSNPLANVVYGKQDDAAQTADVQETNTTVPEAVQPPDRNAEFEKLIKGDYKDLYDARVQDTIQRRLKGTKETVDKYNALSPTLELLGKKYGVDPNDTEALNKAIEEDDAYYEEEALQKGITVEQLKEFRKMEKENATLRQQMQEKNAKEQGAKLYAQWMEQGEKTKAIYPSFDLRAEMQNPKFTDLLRANIDVRTAYEVIHKDDIIPAAMQFTAKTVEQKLTNKIIANGARPTENGVSSQSSAVVKSNVSQLNKADRAEIARRVARGEKISF